MVAFLGSTHRQPGAARSRAQFLADLAGALVPGDMLLLGVDLVKSPERILAAYDDPGGVTAAFSRNVLRVLNDRLGADFDPEAFDHVPRWNAADEWVDIRLRARTAQTVRDRGARPARRLRRAARRCTPRSRPSSAATGWATELGRRGLDVRRWWTDPAEGFGVALAIRL